jgi:hypothetical protein
MPTLAAVSIVPDLASHDRNSGSNDRERRSASCIDPVATCRPAATPVSCTNANIEPGSRSPSGRDLGYRDLIESDASGSVKEFRPPRQLMLAALR